MGKVTYITPSFYNSVWYWRHKEEADIQELYDLIDKKPIDVTELMQEGIDFEDEVFKICQGGYLSDDPVANEVASIVDGSLWQEPIRCEVMVDGDKVIIFGRMDCLKRDEVLDIKKVRKYEVGKYYNSIQHLAYMKGAELKKFKYLVKCGNNLYIEEYREDETNQNLLQERVADFIRWLKNTGLYERYLVKWEIKNG